MDKFISYKNDLNVLNEGFFDFIKKLTGRLIHSLFKADKYEDLLKRVNTLESLIKYGKKINESVSESINENIDITDTRVKRTIFPINDKINEKSDKETIGDDKNDTKNSVNKSVEADKTTTSTASYNDTNEIIDNKIESTKVNINEINLNIPSFPTTIRHLIDSLRKELDVMKTKVDLNAIDDDIKKIRSNKNIRLSAAYIQGLELYTTNFLKKYSKGGLKMPIPSKETKMSKSEVAQWKNLMNDISNGKINTEIEFKSISDALLTVVNTYKDEFKLVLDEFEKKDDKAIEKYKNGDKSTEDIKFKAEWRTKLLSRLDNVCQNCIDFIPTAINDYFINSDVYRETLKYVSKMMELLFAATDVKLTSSNNIFIDIMQSFNTDTIDINDLTAIKESINWPTNNNNSNDTTSGSNNITVAAIIESRDRLNSLQSYQIAYNNFLNANGFPAEFKNNKKNIGINDIKNNQKFNSIIDNLSAERENDYTPIFATLILLKYIDNDFTYKLEINDVNNQPIEINF